MDRIYEDLKDLHVRKVVLYLAMVGEDTPVAYLCWDKEGTNKLTRDEVVEAFLKGCVICMENTELADVMYWIPCGCSVMGDAARVFIDTDMSAYSAEYVPGEPL